MAFRIQEVSGDGLHAAVLPQKRHIVPIRHEADVLAVGLLGVGQAVGGRQSPQGGLFIVSHRQQQMGQLALGQLVEEVRLVLPPVRPRSSCQRPEGPSKRTLA